MLASGSIKLRISKNEISTPTPQAVEALKGLQSFNKIGLMLRSDRPPIEYLIRTAERLLELTGKSVLPLERDIAMAVLADFPEFQKKYTSLSIRLANLGLAGSDRVAELCEQISELLQSDAASSSLSARPGRQRTLSGPPLGPETRGKRSRAGAGPMAERTKRLLSGIRDLPDDDGILDELVKKTETLRNELSDEIKRDDWVSRMPEINQRLSELDSEITTTFHSLAKECTSYDSRRWKEIQESPDFLELGIEDRQGLSADRLEPQLPSSTGIEGLEALFKLRLCLEQPVR